MNFYVCRLVINQITDRDIVLLRLDIKQIVDGNREVVPSDVRIVDGDRDVLLFLRRVVQQRFHSLSQASVVLNPNGQHGHDDTDNQRPIQEEEEDPDSDGTMEGIREQEEVAEGNEEYQSEHDTPLMPDAPRFDMTEQT